MGKKAGNVGDDNVLLGKVEGNVGSRNVILRPEAGTNLMLNKGGLALGHGARADATSVAIGSGAMAGDPKALAIAQLAEAVQNSGNDALIASLGAFLEELQRPAASPGKLKKLFEVVKGLAVAAKLGELANKVSDLL